MEYQEWIRIPKEKKWTDDDYEMYERIFDEIQDGVGDIPDDIRNLRSVFEGETSP